MTSYEQRVSLLEFLSRKPGVSLADEPAAPETLECLIRDVFDDLQRSMAQWREQVTTLEARNKELEEYAHTVAHDLKEPLTVLTMNADLMKDVPDRTVEEWREYRLQIKSTAYEMKSIINSLLLFAQVSKSEAPRGAVQMDRVVANVQARLSYMIKEQVSRDRVARTLVRLVERPRRSVFLGRLYDGLAILNKLFPWTTDWAGSIWVRLQQAEELKNGQQEQPPP